METLIEIFKLGSVGLIAGLFSAYIAIHSHRDKKWWELRVEAYQSLIEALSDLNHYYDKQYTAEIERRELSEESEKELTRIWNDSYHKVRKAADSGAFLFSNDVNKELNKFMNLKNESHNTYFEFLDSYSAATERCLKAVVSLASTDLKIKGTWL